MCNGSISVFESHIWLKTKLLNPCEPENQSITLNEVFVKYDHKAIIREAS